MEFWKKQFQGACFHAILMSFGDESPLCNMVICVCLILAQEPEKRKKQGRPPQKLFNVENIRYVFLLTESIFDHPMSFAPVVVYMGLEISAWLGCGAQLGPAKCPLGYSDTDLGFMEHPPTKAMISRQQNSRHFKKQ